MTSTEFPVDLGEDAEGIGDVFITDASLLVRPRRVPGQYPASVQHDTDHAYRLLALGYDDNKFCWHIISSFDPNRAHKLLDRVFYAFVDACCLQLWCNARVLYIVDGETARVEEYGFEDGEYTLIFKVYCGISADQTEEFLISLLEGQRDHYVVICPDSSETGVNTRGFDPGHAEDQNDQFWEDLVDQW